MVLVFLLLGLLAIIALIILILLMSNIKIEIKKIHISNISGKFKFIFISKLYISLFDKVDVFEIKIDNEKVKKLFKNRKLDMKKIRYNEIFKIIKNNKIYLEKLNIKGYLGLEDAAYTSYIIAFINSIIPLILAKSIFKYDEKRYRYSVNPIYLNQNLVNIELNCIFSIKIVHIINMILNLIKMGRVNKNERTSNRRPYAHSYE